MAWVERLQAACAAPAVAPPTLASKAGGAEQAAELEGSAVPRKISTAVYPDVTPAAEEAAAAVPPDEGGEEAAAAARAAAEDALVAEIAAQAARPALSPAEAAVLERILEVARRCVAASAARLLAMTQKTISTAMLLGRREALHQGLLAVLLRPGAAPACLDFVD